MSLDTLPSVPVHPTEDLLEEYSFGRVLEPALAPLEEHLFDCPLCQGRLLAVDEYTALMKAGIAAMEQEGAAPRPSPRFAIPNAPLAFASAVMLVLVGVTIGWRLQPSPAVASASTMTVPLRALRGGDGDGVARAPFGRPLDLTVDRTDLPAASAYRLEVVSSNGQRLWSGEAQVEPQSLSARVTARLAPGAYWVRLYADNQLRREFGLRVE
ncbi:MAG: hypothetical protein M3N41_07290 [Acidobacteriota bacterium]|nr:hypothetical protein [Acidobacteriota bacterium]